MNETLKLLLDAYVELSKAWEKSNAGENKARVWASAKFLEKQISITINSIHKD